MPMVKRPTFFAEILASNGNNLIIDEVLFDENFLYVEKKNSIDSSRLKRKVTAPAKVAQKNFLDILKVK